MRSGSVAVLPPVTARPKNLRRLVMEFPEGLKFSKEHEWVLVEEKTATIGITEFAQEELGDIVYVELPEVGEKIVKDDPFVAVESVKAVSDVYAPASGPVLEINDLLP